MANYVTFSIDFVTPMITGNFTYPIEFPSYIYQIPDVFIAYLKIPQKIMLHLKGIKLHFKQHRR